MKNKVLRILAIAYAIFAITAVSVSRWFDIDMPWHTSTGSLIFLFIPLVFMLISNVEKKENSNE